MRHASIVINRMNLFPISSCTALFEKQLGSVHLIFGLSPLTHILQQEVSRATCKICGKEFHEGIGRLACSAMAYFVWKESNSRIFKGVDRIPDFLVDQIKYVVKVHAS